MLDLRNILRLCCFLGWALISLGLHAQNSTALWDDSRVSAIYLTLPADSVDSIYADPLGDHYFLSTFIFDDGMAQDTLAQVGLRLRGNTSRFSEKKSFKISFNTYQLGRRYQGVKKLNLNGEHNDPTMCREKLFYEVWERCGMPGRNTTFVRLFINQTFMGLYTCLEEPDKDWLQRVYGENDGNFYKCTYPADMVYQGTNQQTYKNIPSASATGGRAYDLQTNKALDDYNGFVTLVTQLNRTPDAQFAAEIGQYLNVEHMLRALAIDVATGNWDNYAYNKNNYLLYHSLAGPFEFFTYDTDNTFGVDWVQRNWATRDCADWLSHSEPRPLASKLLTVQAFRGRYYEILDSITRFVTRPDSIFPRIDQMEDLLMPYVGQDTFRSLDYGYDSLDFHLGFTGTVDGHTPYGIKPFLQTRYSSTLNQLAAVENDPVSDIFNSITVFPNPTREVLNLHFSGINKPGMRVVLLNAMGQAIRTQGWSAWEPNLGLDLQAVPAGCYWLRMEPETGASTSRQGKSIPALGPVMVH